MVRAVARFYSCTEIVALGTLNGLFNGKGALDSRLVDLEMSMNGENSLFAPLRALYYQAHGTPEPVLSLTMETANTFEIERLREVLKSINADETAE